MTISIRLTPEEEERLEKLSKRTGRSKSFYVRAALREHLTDLEDAFAAVGCLAMVGLVLVLPAEQTARRQPHAEQDVARGDVLQFPPRVSGAQGSSPF